MGRKWAKIVTHKTAQDQKRGKLFTKLIREITVATRAGGADPAMNARLRLAIDKALAGNMTKDAVERAIKRGSSDGSDAHLDEVRYEGYGPGGVAILVECMTDNRTRTIGEVRHAFGKHGGNVGADGSVAYLFTRVGVIAFDTREAPAQEEKILEAALDAGATDVQTEEGLTEVLTSPETFEPVKAALAAAGLTAITADIAMRPSTTVALSGATAEAVAHLLERLEELDDVQNVYSNADLESLPTTA